MFLLMPIQRANVLSVAIKLLIVSIYIPILWIYERLGLFDPRAAIAIDFGLSEELTDNVTKRD